MPAIDYNKLLSTGGYIGLIYDSAGQLISPDSMAKTVTSDSQGRVISVSVTDGTNTWVQTIAYPSSTVTTISQWVKQ